MTNNSSDPGPDNTTRGSNPPMFSHEEMVAWCFGFGIIDALVFLSNTLTILVFTRSKLLRKRTNYFLLCLAIADMMVSTISLPMFLHTLIVFSNDGKLITWIDLVSRLVDIFTGFASVFALTVISLERLYSVALPSWHRTTPSYVYGLSIATIWTLAAVLLSIKIFDDQKMVQENAFLYVVIVSFFICLAVICLAYVGIWIKVRQRMHEKTKKSLEKDKRLAWTLFLVTAIFVLTWLPFQVMNVVAPVVCKTSCRNKDFLNLVYLTKMLQYTNSFINPIIYTFKMPDFRRVLLALFGRNSYGASSTRASSKMLTERRKRASSARSSDYEPNGNCEHAV